MQNTLLRVNTLSSGKAWAVGGAHVDGSRGMEEEVLSAVRDGVK